MIYFIVQFQVGAYANSLESETLKKWHKIISHLAPTCPYMHIAHGTKLQEVSENSRKKTIFSENPNKVTIQV